MVKMCGREQMSRYLSEFLGTACLACAYKLILSQSKEFAPAEMKYTFYGIFTGITLMALSYLFGYNSMAMFNPAVTLGHALRNSKYFKCKDFDQWIIYIVLQLCGGVVGATLSAAIGGKFDGDQYWYINRDVYEKREAFFSELLFTFALVSVHIHCGSDERIAGNQFYGIAIGCVQAVAGAAIYPITGGVLNPSVWFGGLMSAWYEKDDDFMDLEEIKISWIYPAAHFVAAIYAAFWFHIIYENKEANHGIKEEEEEEEEEASIEKNDEVRPIVIIPDEKKDQEQPSKAAKKGVDENADQTKAHLIIFDIHDDNARDYGYKLIDEIMAIKGVKDALYEKNLKVIDLKKAQVNLVLRRQTSERAKDNPLVKKVHALLKKKGDKVKKIKINDIPYFL